MRNLKKVLSLVLCMAMMLSIMVVGAGAAFKDQSKIVNTEAVDMCVALNIINGYTDGSYKPEGNVTRAEMCKMICIALNGGKEPATATKAVPTYSDIDGHWAEGYIEYCNTKGIVAGIGGGKFNPNGNVTGSQAAKMLLIALGYNADVEKYVGASWELYVNVQANQDGLYTDLETMDPSAALSRDNAAQMIWNTLQAYVINKSSSIDREDGSITDVYTKSDKVDLLDKMYKGEIVEGTLNSFTYDSNKGEWTYTVTGIATVNNEESGSVKVKSTVDYTDLLGQNVKAVYDKTGKAPYEAYGIFANDSEVVLTGIIADLPDIVGSDKSFKVDGVKYNLTDVASNIDICVFNSVQTIDLLDAAQKGATAYDAQEFTAIDRDGDGDIDYLVVVPYAVAKVTYKNADKFKVEVKADPFGIMGKDTSGKAITTGTYEFDDVNAYEGLAKNDYVTIIAAANTADNTDTFKKVDQINGKIVAKDGTDVSVDGTWYTVDKSYVDAKIAYSAGTSLTDAAVVNGFIFDADTSSSKDVDDYAVIVDIVAKAANGMNGAQAKLLFSDGTKTTVDLADDYATKGFAKGDLVVFDINSDDEYELKKAPTDKASTGFDVTNAAASITKASNSSSKVGYIGGNQVADDSVIFIRYNGDDFKVITGAQLKTMGVADFGSNKAYVLATENDKTGVNTVDMAYVTATTTDINANDSFYAYVTKVLEAKNSDDKDIYTVTLWTADGEKVLNTVKNYNNDNKYLTAGNVIEYKMNADGEINSVLWGADASNSAWTTLSNGKGYSTAAITSWNGTIFQFNSDGSNRELDDDIVYLFIDDSETEGLTGYTSADINVADKDINGNLIKNAFVLLDTTANDRNVLLVVYDVDNEF